jgi:hypothetical protein
MYFSKKWELPDALKKLTVPEINALFMFALF